MQGQGKGKLIMCQEYLNELETFIKDSFKLNIDCGIIPGISKPTLLKPGAEKLLKFLNFHILKLEELKEESNPETGFFEMSYKCEVGNFEKTFGSCIAYINSLESKFRYKRISGKQVEKSPEEKLAQKNTVSKVGQKRAFVGAVLIASCTSSYFTQDVEDYEELKRESALPPPPAMEKETETKKKKEAKKIQQPEPAPKTEKINPDNEKQIKKNNLLVEILKLIQKSNLDELINIYNSHPDYQNNNTFLAALSARKAELKTKK